VKIWALPSGSICRVLGIELELEVIEHLVSSVLVRPTARHEITFYDDTGDLVSISVRPKAFRVSRETEVEEVA
jgi:hypothetical protein